MTGNDPLGWLEEVLKAERRSVELTLATRHAKLLKDMAPLLQNAKMPETTTSGQGSVVMYHDTPTSGNRQVQVFKKEETWSGCMPCQGRPATPPDAKMESIDAAEEEAPKEDAVVTDDGRTRTAPGTPGAPSQEIPGWRGKVAKIVDAWEFDAFIALIIVTNSICIGIESSFDLQKRDTGVFQVLEHLFLIIYIIELVMRFVAHGYVRCLSDGWVVFDVCLVFLGAVTLYIVGPLLESNQEAQEAIAALLVLRMLRLFRLARLIRLVASFEVLWKLVQGLIGSLGTICYAFALIMLILYVFACISLELISKRLENSPNDDVRLLVANNFPNLQITMLTLIQFVTIDSLSGIYFPLIREDPILVLYFLPFILVMSVSLTNLVTAVIVEGAIEQGKEDAEMKKKVKARQFRKILPKLRASFKEMDEDGNDLLTENEIVNARQDIKEELGKFVDEDGLKELFEMIDTDESGEINCDEFCDGMAKLVSSESPVELVRILKQLKLVRRDLDLLKSGNWITEASFGPNRQAGLNRTQTFA